MRLPSVDVPPSRPTLDALPLRRPARVLGVTAPPGAPEWARWLEDLGFVPGETVALLARARPGGDPVVVRVGDSTFALRLAEAACVAVEDGA